jgi:hypothetical protein
MVQLPSETRHKLLFPAVFLLELLIFYIHPYIVDIMVYATRNFLADLGYQANVIHWEMLYRHIPVLDLPTVLPSPGMCLTVIVGSVILVIAGFVIPKFPRLLAVYITFLSIINICSAVFFLWVPEQFPYTVGVFSMLYIGTEVGLWILIPMVLAIALYSMPESLGFKLLFILFNLIYSIFFGTIRFAAFLFLLEDYSVIFMAIYYFAFGPLFDFVYLVGFYSLFMSNLSESAGQGFRRWKWLY